MYYKCTTNALTIHYKCTVYQNVYDLKLTREVGHISCKCNTIHIRGNHGGVKMTNQKKPLLNRPSRTPRIIPKRF